MSIRHITEDDIDWMYEVGGGYYNDVNEQDAKDAFRKVLHGSNALCIRSDTAVFVGRIGSNPYNHKEIIMEDCFFFGKGVIELMKVAMVWAKERGATDFNFSLGYESRVKTLKSLARKLGAKALNVELYNIKLV